MSNRLQIRRPLVWDLIDEWLTHASSSTDPFRLEPVEVEAIRVMLAFAEAANFPSLTLPEYGYTIQGDLDGWLRAAQQLAGTPAVRLTTRLLQGLRKAGSPALADESTPLGDGTTVALHEKEVKPWR
ncbi:MAG: hypothetical protein WHS44_05560 [Fimbriimonadales bacterium]|nr:MAG: hypothetical protein KatS3mg018_2465 [Fimbriimonadales bacterium]